MTLQSLATNSMTQAAASAPDAKLKDACRQFESIFFGMMIKEMRKTIPEDTLLGDEDHRQEIFQGMMDDEVSKQMAQRDTRGSLADLMYRQLAGTRVAQNAPPVAADAAQQITAAQAAASAAQLRETETLK